jgi:hypothetical protein
MIGGCVPVVSIPVVSTWISVRNWYLNYQLITTWIFNLFPLVYILSILLELSDSFFSSFQTLFDWISAVFKIHLAHL